jgi:cytochrome c-type protein NapC
MQDKVNFLVSYWRAMTRPSPIALWIIATFFFVSGILYMRAFDWTMTVTNTEQFCIGCHEMEDNVYPAYTKSVHFSNRSGVRAMCSDCHVPHNWADKVVRKIQASKEVWGKITGKIDTPEKFAEHRLALAQREWARFRKNDSLECRNCHDQEFMDYDKQSLPAVKMHSTMLATGKLTCIDCHKGIAHVLPQTRDLQLISPAVLEPMNRPPFDHAATTRE